MNNYTLIQNEVKTLIALGVGEGSAFRHVGAVYRVANGDQEIFRSRCSRLKEVSARLRRLASSRALAQKKKKETAAALASRAGYAAPCPAPSLTPAEAVKSGAASSCSLWRAGMHGQSARLDDRGEFLGRMAEAAARGSRRWCRKNIFGAAARLDEVGGVSGSDDRGAWAELEREALSIYRAAYLEAGAAWYDEHCDGGTVEAPDGSTLSGLRAAVLVAAVKAGKAAMAARYVARGRDNREVGLDFKLLGNLPAPTPATRQDQKMFSDWARYCGHLSELSKDRSAWAGRGAEARAFRALAPVAPVESVIKRNVSSYHGARVALGIYWDSVSNLNGVSRRAKCQQDDVDLLRRALTIHGGAGHGCDGGGVRSDNKLLLQLKRLRSRIAEGVDALKRSHQVEAARAAAVLLQHWQG